VKPTKGRIVWYWTQIPVAGGGTELFSWAAIVTDVFKTGPDAVEVVELAAWPPGEDARIFHQVCYSEEPKYGHWSWPTRMEA
jgi:hypothetical protein